MLSLAWSSKYGGGQLGLKGLATLDGYCSEKLKCMLPDRIVVSNKNIYAI